MEFLEKIDQSLRRAENVVEWSEADYNVLEVDKGLEYNEGLEEAKGYLEDEEILKESSSCLVDYSSPNAAADLVNYLCQIHDLDDLTVGKVAIDGFERQEPSSKKTEIEAELKAEARENEYEKDEALHPEFYWELETEYDRDEVSVNNALYRIGEILERTGLEVEGAPERPRAEGAFDSFFPK
jgi:hypothetical protein